MRGTVLARHPALVPLVAWACALAAVVAGAALLGYTPWNSATWSRWDSGHYEAIARDGYELFPCEEEPEKWCGNTGWLPGYPWLVGGVHALGLPLRGTAVAVSWLLAASTLVLLWATFLERRAEAAVVGGLFYAAFAPGQIYQYAVFPISLLAFATVAFLWLLHRERYVAAGLAGAVAAISYPAGVALVPVAAVWLLLQRRLAVGERLRRAAITCGLTTIGIWIVMLVQRLETGHWDAFFLVQAKYEHELQNPFTPTWEMIRGGLDQLADEFAVAIALQTALVTLALALTLVFVLWRRRPLESVEWLLLLWALATWALPLSQSGVSVQRGQATLLPLAILVARLPGPLVWALAIVAAVIAIWMERYFLDYTLV